MVYRNTAEQTFDNFKLVFYSLLRLNPLMNRKETSVKINPTTDAIVHHVCQLMEWDYEMVSGIVTSHLLFRNGCFMDLEDEIEEFMLVNKLRYEGAGE
jgi:hypothetical protein